MKQPHKSVLSGSDLDLAAKLWAAGVFSERISERLSISDSTFTTLRSRRRDIFPIRPFGGEKPKRKSDVPPREPRSDSSRYARSFLPLPSCQPEPFSLSSGCSWPVYGEAMNPLESPTATHVCGQPKLVRGDRVMSYCAVHYRVAYAPRAA